MWTASYDIDLPAMAGSCLTPASLICYTLNPSFRPNTSAIRARARQACPLHCNGSAAVFVVSYQSGAATQLLKASRPLISTSSSVLPSDIQPEGSGKAIRYPPPSSSESGATTRYFLIDAVHPCHKLFDIFNLCHGFMQTLLVCLQSALPPVPAPCRSKARPLP